MTDDELLYFDLYGCKDGNLDLVKESLEGALGIRMRERESSYYARYFSFRTNKDEYISCVKNWNWDDDEILFKEYQEYSIIVQISGTLHPEEFEQKLKTSKIQFYLLERELA